ncbi:hypothetical protein FUA48_17745 [Flavobacterium alkalisoli]|uniref:Glycosyltransferase family 4 protein n=1 Tax=Flavobacterium alkalisoli TaxID=2602769 RepID=A0A5B9FVX8_9FLAO|nr:hypothetical protein [Flavobacterium alkalisoli]QEE51343.1 hypothetical protein FUA48_17745 [Flavobacterium alkalisoli]
MKICLISFDHWEYDKHIVRALKDKNIEAYHINTGKFKYKYPTPFHKITNFLSKVVFKRNIKKIKQQQYILKELNKLGTQDKILVINPELIPVAIHKKIKSYTKEYIAYLYDSSKRYPIDHLLDNIFDKILSFDSDDVAQYGFSPISNYIYMDKKPLQQPNEVTYGAFMILSVDERLQTLNAIANRLDTININYNFMLVGKHKPTGLNTNISYQRDIIKLDRLDEYMSNAKVFIDIVRVNQTGLSFRVFDALCYQKKLITTNKTIKDYDFYNPNNILIVDADNPIIEASFFETPYEPLDENIYYKYTIDNWVNTVFFDKGDTI